MEQRLHAVAEKSRAVSEGNRTVIGDTFELSVTGEAVNRAVIWDTFELSGPSPRRGELSEGEVAIGEARRLLREQRDKEERRRVQAAAAAAEQQVVMLIVLI